MRFIRRLAVRSMGSMEFNRGNSKEKQGDLNCYRLQERNEGIRGETFLWRLVDGYSGTVKGYT